jgi:hypothetical protein
VSAQFQEMISKLPERCLLTGMDLCKSYSVTDENGCNHALYLMNPAYDGYTPFEYDSENREFTHRRYDLDEAMWKEWESYELNQLIDHPRFDEIVKYYGVSDADIALARQDSEAE